MSEAGQKPKKKRSKGKDKGNAFERIICHRLSNWWTHGMRDDVFWRSAASGGRATNRANYGKKTAGSYGDICSTDPSSNPFTDLLTVELKRGYSKFTVFDLMDRHYDAKMQLWEEWYCQVHRSWLQSGSYSWLMIQCRDGRVPIVFFPEGLYDTLNDNFDTFLMPDPPFMQFRVNIRYQNQTLADTVCATTLKKFLEAVSPEDIRQLSKTC